MTKEKDKEKKMQTREICVLIHKQTGNHIATSEIIMSLLKILKLLQKNSFSKNHISLVKVILKLSHCKTIEI